MSDGERMLDGERVEQLICDWLDRNYPDGPTWYGRSASEAPPLEIKMIPAFGEIEYNLGNGGWAQFLWNCFRRWREIINVAKAGYLLIGAPEQSAALTELWTLCERDERECREMQEQRKWLFSEFTSRSYMVPGNDWERLFYGKEIYEKRLAWLAANEARLRKPWECCISKRRAALSPLGCSNSSDAVEPLRPTIRPGLSAKAHNALLLSFTFSAST